MRFHSYICEQGNKEGLGLTAVDIDETLFHTFAKIKIMKNGKVVRELTNQEYNNYKPTDGEVVDYSEFRSAEIFNKTSIPIQNMLDRIANMLPKARAKGSKIILLTARTDFSDKNLFLDTFRKAGFPIDDIHVERSGNLAKNQPGNVAGVKKKVIFDYLATGLYRRFRIFDDDITNCKMVLKLKDELPQKIYDAIRQRYDIGIEVPDKELITFEAFLVDAKGSARRI